MNLSQVYSFNIFIPTEKVWTHFVRSTFHQGWWKVEATTQSGRTIHSELITDEHLSSIWSRLSHLAEITPFS